MTNEIPNLIKANVPGPVQVPGHSARLEAVKSPQAGSQALPEEGKELPKLVSSQSVNNTELKEVVSEMNDFVQSVQRNLSFSLDEGSGHTVIKVVDTNSGELIRQIPSEDVLAVASQLRDIRDMLDTSSSPAKGLLFSDST